MKKSFILIICILFIHSLLFAQSTKITDQNIGDIKLNQGINTLKNHQGWLIKQETISIDNQKQPIYKIFEDNKLIFEVEAIFNKKTKQATNKIFAITTYSNQYKSINRISVGSNLADVIKLYPNDDYYIIKDRRENFVIHGEMETTDYIIDPKSYIGSKEKLEGNNFSKEDFKTKAKLTGICIRSM